MLWYELLVRIETPDELNEAIVTVSLLFLRQQQLSKNYARGTTNKKCTVTNYENHRNPGGYRISLLMNR